MPKHPITHLGPRITAVIQVSRQDVAATRHMKMMKSIAEKMQTFAVCMIICVCVTMCACISKKRNGHVHTYVCTCVHACNTLVTSRDITSHHISSHHVALHCITCVFVRFWAGGAVLHLYPTHINARILETFDVTCICIPVCVYVCSLNVNGNVRANVHV